MSLHEYNLLLPERPYVGLQNWKEVLNDPFYFDSLITTFIVAVVCLSIELILGFLISLYFNARRGNFSSLIQNTIVVPVMMAPCVVGVLWKLFLNRHVGLLDFMLESMGLPVLLNPDSEVGALPSVMVVEIWHWTPFVALIFYAGLQMIPPEYYEAATVDGASSTQILRRITLPLLREVFLVILLFRIADILKLFDEISMLTFGGPMRITHTVTFYIYRTAFCWFDFGNATVQSFIFHFIVVIAAVLLINRIRRVR